MASIQVGDRVRVRDLGEDTPFPSTFPPGVKVEVIGVNTEGYETLILVPDPDGDSTKWAFYESEVEPVVEEDNAETDDETADLQQQEEQEEVWPEDLVDDARADHDSEADQQYSTAANVREAYRSLQDLFARIGLTILTVRTKTEDIEPEEMADVLVAVMEKVSTSLTALEVAHPELGLDTDPANASPYSILLRAALGH